MSPTPLTDTLTIRRGRSDDAAAILAAEALFPGDRMSARSVRHFLRAPSAEVWVAVSADGVVGNLIWLQRRGSRSGRIYSLVIVPAARGRGGAERLITAAENSARALGLTEMALEVRADNDAARQLYHKLGYRLKNKLSGYYEDGGDGLKLVKTLIT